MAKLADITSETRIVLKILAGSLITVIALFLILKGGIIFKTIFFPAPTPPPQEQFGKLPFPAFPKQDHVSFDYQINTIDGKLPDFPPYRMNIYKIFENQPSLVALQNARSTMQNAGFFQDETKLNDSIYQWSDSNGNTIQYDIFTNNFKVSSNLSASGNGISLTKESALQGANNFLGNVSEDTSDINQDKSTLLYLKLDNGNLVQAEGQTDAQFAKINLFQNDLNKYPIYYPEGAESSMYFIFRDDSGFPKLVNAGYFHFLPDLKTFSDYPIKSAEQAFEDLKKGNAYVVTGVKQGSTIDILNVTLGYYIGEGKQDYFLPVIVFSGNGFTAYVPAIPNELIQQ